MFCVCFLVFFSFFPSSLRPFSSLGRFLFSSLFNCLFFKFSLSLPSVSIFGILPLFSLLFCFIFFFFSQFSLVNFLTQILCFFRSICFTSFSLVCFLFFPQTIPPFSIFHCRTYTKHPRQKNDNFNTLSLTIFLLFSYREPFKIENDLFCLKEFSLSL